MGLISRTSTIKWNGANKNWYESKGYPFTKLNDEFEVIVEHLSIGTKSTVACECDSCGKKVNNIRWRTYLISITHDGNYYCQKCKAKSRKKPNKKSTKKKSHRNKKTKICFAQWCIDNISPNFLELYWDYERNNELGINPWKLTSKTNQKVWVKCQEREYHDSYYVSVSNFTSRNSRCPYCTHRKIHPMDSLGEHIVNVYGKSFLNSIWSDKNKKSLFEYPPKSNQKVWWKCIKGKHDDFIRNIHDSNTCDFRCPNCNKVYKGEKRIEDYLVKNNIVNESQKSFDNLIGLGFRSLSYDFYLPSYNILIEYQGEYHDGTARNQTKSQFKKQQEHDKRKREYAKLHNIKLLEIWYYDFDRIEEILKYELN